jgi:hypothetical protein
LTISLRRVEADAAGVSIEGVQTFFSADPDVPAGILAEGVNILSHQAGISLRQMPKGIAVAIPEVEAAIDPSDPDNVFSVFVHSLDKIAAEAVGISWL